MIKKFPTNLKHFEKSEFNAPDVMCHELLYRLDALRDYLGLPIIITSSFRLNNETSQHGKGRAVDFVVRGWQGSLYSLYLIVERFGFTGIGIYPDWSYIENSRENGSKRVYSGGFHVDTRIVKNYQSKRWIGKSLDLSGQKLSKTQYYSFNLQNLIKLKIITFSKQQASSSKLQA